MIKGVLSPFPLSFLSLLPRGVSCRGHRRCRPAPPLRFVATGWWWWCDSWCRTGPPSSRQTAANQTCQWNHEERQGRREFITSSSKEAKIVSITECQMNVLCVPLSPTSRLWGLIRGLLMPFILWYSPQALHR